MGRSSLSPVMRHSLRRLVTAIVAGLVVVAALAVASGRIDWFATSGVSMNPTYYAGDLVVVVRDAPYEVGQIVAYRNPANNVVVLHRIVGGDATGWEFKGDNNQSVDPTHPSSDMLLGRAVLHVPKVGRVLTSPIARGVALLAALILLGALIMTSRRTRSSVTDAVVSDDRSSSLRMVWIGLIVLDLLLLAGVGVAIAFAAHPSGPGPTYSQTGTLTYTATVAGSETYPTGVIQPGDAVFTKLVRKVDVSFHHDTDAPAGSVAGTAQLDLSLSTAAGWHSVLPLAASVPLEGGRAALTGTLDLRDIQSLADRVGNATGTSVGVLRVVIRASGSATINGGPPVAYTMEFPFELSPLALTAVGATPAQTQALVSTVALPPAPDSGTAVGGLVPATLKLPIIVALLVCLALTVLLWPPTQADEPAEDERPLRTRVDGIQVPPSVVRVRVMTSEEIDAIAIRLNLPVLEDDKGCNGVLTPQALYWTGGDPSPAGPPPPPPPPPPNPVVQWIGSEMTCPAQLDRV